MVYFMHLKLLSAKMVKGGLHAVNYLTLEVEFTQPSQEDGHMPSHGDMRRDFAESIIRNLPRRPVADLLKKEGIRGFKESGRWTAANVQKTDRIECFLPVYIMELRIPVVVEEDLFLSLSDQLLNCIGWEEVKEAIVEGGVYGTAADTAR